MKELQPDSGLPPITWRPWNFWAKRWGQDDRPISRSTMYEKYIPFLRTAIVGGRLRIEDASALQFEANGFQAPKGAAPTPRRDLLARKPRRDKPRVAKVAKRRLKPPKLERTKGRSDVPAPPTKHGRGQPRKHATPAREIAAPAD